MNLQENIHRIKEMMAIDEQIPDSRFLGKQDGMKNISSLSVDDTVDVISAVVDGVPGLGNLISLGIDLIHTLSYVVRFSYSKTDEEKIEFATLAFITLGSSFIPVGGNSLPIIARQGVKSVLSKTPKEILMIAKKYGLYNGTTFFLQKGRWKYSLLLLLARIIGDELAEFLNLVTQKLNTIYDKIKNVQSLKNISAMVLKLVVLVKELSEHADVAIQLVKTNQI